MSEAETRRPAHRLHSQFEAVVEWLRPYEGATRPAPALATVQQQLDELHPAAIAFILESLPLDERFCGLAAGHGRLRRRDPAGGL